MASLSLSEVFFVPPVRLFDAWLSAAEQTRITGEPASIDAKVGGRYSLWGGMVTGEIVHLSRPHVIAMTWSTVDFGPGTPPTRLELRFDPVLQGTRLLVTQDQIPQMLLQRFGAAWTEFYFPALKVHVAPLN
ncbi:MAG: SRPBCC domain-containing protein [Alphaproteobacteria bacterium]|nr:SRPBCC domain-containing protein [Alphaproteobacteria bacterium]